MPAGATHRGQATPADKRNYVYQTGLQARATRFRWRYMIRIGRPCCQ